MRKALFLISVVMMGLGVDPAIANKHHGMHSAMLEQCNYPGYAKRHPDQCPAQAMILQGTKNKAPNP